MRHGFPLLFLAWGAVMILIALVKLARGAALPDVAAFGILGLFGIVLAAATWSSVGGRPEEVPQAAALGEQPKTVPAREQTVPLLARMSAHLRAALGVWLAVVVLASVAGVVRLSDTTYALTIGLHRFGHVFWPCLVVFLVAELLVLWGSQHGWAAGAWSSKMLAAGFSIVAVFFGVTSAIALLNGSNPWEYLPGGPPFALREFAAKHPQLDVVTLGFGGTVVAVRQGSLPRVILSEGELRNAVLSWEAFTAASEPQRLGGPPPFPNSRCWARLHIRRPDYDALSEEDLDKDVAPPEIRTVMYVYDTGWASTREVTGHFLTWAKSVGPEPPVYGYYSKSMEVAAGRTWTIDMLGTRRGVHAIYVAYRDAPAPGAAKEK